MNIKNAKTKISAILSQKGVFYLSARALSKFLLWAYGSCISFVMLPVCSFFKLRFVTVSECAIGHLGIEMDCYLKEGLLGLRPKYSTILLAPPYKIANRHLLGYWKKYFKRTVTSGLACRLLLPLVENRRTGYKTYRFCFSDDGTPSFPSVQKLCKDMPPLLAVSDEDRERGWQCLRKLGLKEGDWFVALHCRQDGFTGKAECGPRNADINSYSKAIDAIIRRGGWVVRLGDKNMPALQKKDRLVDYAHTDFKSEWMDIFLCAECRFFLASHSGVYNIANIFGKPAAVTNWAHWAGILSYGPGDITIPKLAWSDRENRFWNFKEILSRSNTEFTTLYENGMLRMIDNTPEEIESLVEEMFARLEGKEVYTHEDERLQERFKSLMIPLNFSYGAVSRVGRDFLRKYAALMG